MSRHYDTEDEDAKFVLCQICESDIIIDFYSEIGDTVSCDDCGTSYILRSLSPIKIALIEGEDDDESCADLNFDD